MEEAAINGSLRALNAVHESAPEDAMILRESVLDEAMILR
jgi:hypothetical protein